MSTGIKWKGPTLDPSGYGTANRDYVAALHKVGAELTIDPWNFEAKPAEFYGDTGKLIEKLKNKKINYEYVIHHYVPNQVGSVVEKDCLNVGYSTWETDRIPDLWVENINQYFDIQLVPSEFNKSVYENSGIQIPVEVIPHCLDIDPFDDAQSLEMPGYEDHFKFLSVFQWTERKNPIGLLKAYFSEFYDSKDKVVLILKTYRSNTSMSEREALKSEIRKLKNELKFHPEKTPPVYLLGELLTRNEMISLYKSTDCFVLPSRGEGFGIPFAEAAAARNTIIATDFSGHCDFLRKMRSPTYCGINYFLTPVAHMPWIPHYSGTMNWAEPNISELKSFMRQMFEMGKDKYMYKDVAREVIKKYLNYEKIGNLFLEKLETGKEKL